MMIYERREHMKNIMYVVVALSFAALMGCQKMNGEDSTAGIRKVERGRYLVTTTGCNDCHTPLKMTARGPEPDMARMLSGHPAELKMPRPPKLGEGPWMWAGAATNTAFYGPWGVSYAMNLTPDQNT